MQTPRLSVLLLVLCWSATAQLGGAGGRAQDLAWIRNQLPALHPNLFFQLDPNTWNAAADKLAADSPMLDDAHFYTRLAQLTALPNDPHTFLYLTIGNATGVFRTLPLRFRWLDDGVFVISAAAPYSKAVGARLTRIGDTPMSDIEARLATLIPHDNDQWLHSFGVSYLIFAEVLEGLDIVPTPSPIPFRFQSLDGTEFSLQVEPSTAPLISATPAETGSIPMWLQNPGVNYWFTYSAANRMLYFRYSACSEQANNPFTTFAANLLRTLDTNPVDTFVFDIRANGGGSSSLVAPVINGLAQRFNTLAANPHFRIFDVFDKGTFSSGVLNAADLKEPVPQSIPAQFPNVNLSRLVTSIGEATGGRSYGYGNVSGFSLPASGFSGQYSTRYFNPPPGIPAGPSLFPDIAVAFRSTDFFARFDPVMAAILTRAPAQLTPPSGDTIAVNAASFRPERGLAPGSYAAAFGSFSKTPDAVRVASVDAKVVFASASQVNFLLGDSTPTGPAALSVGAAGEEISTGTVQIASAAPGLFGPTLNEDGSLNGTSNPAAPGGIAVLYGTGQGSANPAVWFAETPAPQILYTGGVINLPGLWQINVVIPAGLTGIVPVFAAAEGIPSNAVTLYLK
jgi:uncharacterized protein (TIGR03437 family)